METDNRITTSYFLSLGWFFGLGGLHRLYNGKIYTGIFWLCTFGVFGMGQFVDLFLIPGMVEEYESRLRSQQGLLPVGMLAQHAISQRDEAQSAIAEEIHRPSYDALTVQLLKNAAEKGGKINVTQGVMSTGASFTEVEGLLKEIMKSGYARIDNDPVTGVVTYHFDELS